MTSQNESSQHAARTDGIDVAGFSADAVASMRRSLEAGGGRMAQFDHPEFGGAGQWMLGGMLMLPDWSDSSLRARVGRLCDSIAHDRSTHGSDSPDTAVRSDDPGPSSPWWSAALGHPSTSGSQNSMRYAWFPETRRLAIADGDTVTVHDTGDHRIGGVSQQQGGHGTLAFTSQHGLVDLASLPVVNDRDSPARREVDDTPSAPESRDSASGDPFEALDKLAALHGRGVLTDDEYALKKADLLDRI